MRRLTPLLLAALTGCGVTPLTNKVNVGEEAYLIVVGEGVDGNTDLFAAPGQGGVFAQLTFTRGTEGHPTLDSTGTRLAFTRQRDPTDRSVELVLLDLKSMSEASGPIPIEAGPVERLAWHAHGDSVIVATSQGIWTTAAQSPVSLTASTGPAAARLDSASYPRIGSPAFARLRTCRSGRGLCVVTDSGEETALDARATDGTPWGPAAIGYLVEGHLEVRPLGGGRVRQPSWSGTPSHLRQPTYYPGSAAR